MDTEKVGEQISGQNQATQFNDLPSKLGPDPTIWDGQMDMKIE